MIPPHLSERLFRYFEPHIALAVRNWPKETCFDLSLLPVEERYSPATFVGRFRDAVLSLKRFGWSTSIDVEKLWTLSGKYTIWHESGTTNVWWKEKRRAGRPSHMIGEARRRGSLLDDPEEDASPSVVLWKDCTPEEIDAAVVLVAGKRLTGPVYFDVLLGREKMEEYMSRYDIALTEDNEGRMILT